MTESYSDLSETMEQVKFAINKGLDQNSRKNLL